MSVAGRSEVKTIGDVMADIWQAKSWILSAAFLGVIGAFLFMSSAVPHMKSHMIISPANPMNGAESSSLLADENLFALRFLMQRVGSGSSSSDFTRFENMYDGSSVAGILLRDPKIVAGLKEDKRFSFTVPESEWSEAALSDYIHERVRLEGVGTSPLRRMVYTHPDAEFGKYFLSALHRVTDGLIRETVRTEASQRVAHLRRSMRENNNPDHRRALTSLLMEQERLLMLASVETPYAASVVEPPASNAKPAWPSPALVYAAFIAAFSMIGFLMNGVFAKTENVAAVRRKSISAKKWFKSDSGNSNRPLTLAPDDNKRDAA